jgi:methionyl-tRNA formyltransferase
MKILYLGVEPYELKDFLEEGNEVVYTSEKIEPGFITENNIELCISYRYRHIIKQNIIDESGDNIINLHISMLPWNRGSDPNLWSFLEGTPKGVTIHHVDAGVDTGDVIFQREVSFNKSDTLSSSYQKLNDNLINLFIEKWYYIKKRKYKRMKQDISEGNTHRMKHKEPHMHLLEKDGWNTQVSSIDGFLKERTDKDIIDDVQKIRERNNVNWMDAVRLCFELAPDRAREIFKDIKECDRIVNELLEELSENDAGGET